MGNMGKRTVSVFGACLKQAREAKQMSQEALAEALGVSRTMVQKWERGECHPTVNRLQTIASALGVSQAMLLGESPVAAPAPSADDRILHMESLIEEVLRRLPPG